MKITVDLLIFKTKFKKKKKKKKNVQGRSDNINDQLFNELPGRFRHLLRAWLHGTSFGETYRPSGDWRARIGFYCLPRGDRYHARIYILVAPLFHDAHDPRPRQLSTAYLMTLADCIEPDLYLIFFSPWIQQFGGSEAIITALSDEYPIIGRHREIFVGCLFSVYFIVGLASCSQVYILTSSFPFLFLIIIKYLAIFYDSFILYNMSLWKEIETFSKYLLYVKRLISSSCSQPD